MVDLDKDEIELQCPKCNFYNYIFIKQARLRDIIICRGCKYNIQLDDQMNEVRKGVRNSNEAIRRLKDSLKDINIEIKF